MKSHNNLQYNGYTIEVISSFSPANGDIFYVRVNGIQQIDYARGRGDFKTPDQAVAFAKQLIDSNDLD